MSEDTECGRSRVAEGDIIRVQFGRRKETVGQTEAAQRGRKFSGRMRGRKGGLPAKSRENYMKTRGIVGLSGLDDIRRLGIQPGLWPRRLKRTARTECHRVLFQSLSRHRALHVPARRPVIDGRSLRRIRERIVIVPERFVLIARARHEVRDTSELRMAAAQPGRARDNKQTSAEQSHAQRFSSQWERLGFRF